MNRIERVSLPREARLALPVPRANRALPFLGVFLFLVLLGQAAIVVQARPQDLITGAPGIADILRRVVPARLLAYRRYVRTGAGNRRYRAVRHHGGGADGPAARGPGGAQHHAGWPFYAAARGIIALCRSVPDLVWALLFVTAVGLGPFPGALAVSVHSIGMLGRLFAEVVEDMNMGTVEALTMSGASRLQVFSHAVVPSVLPSLLGIALYRLDENIRASLVLGFVGAGGLGFQLLTAMNLFQYRTVSLLLIVTFAIVILTERLSAALRARI